METFCTIITSDYLPKALVLYKSLWEYNKNVTLQVLVADNNPVPAISSAFTGINIIDLNSLSANPLLKRIYEKYAYPYIDHFRWALKPILLSYLIERFNKVVYVDCDIFFANNYAFIFNELDTSPILLTPHWQNINPLSDESSFVSTFTEGIFNAGFIGANKNSVEALNWWAQACHFKMGTFHNIGIQDDQKYLDIFPVFFENTKILRHKGCNVAAWNTQECKRTLVNGNVLINKEFPIIFIHFNDMLIKQVLKGHDPLLAPFLNNYKKMFEIEGFSLFSYTEGINYYLNSSALTQLKWKLRVRSRIKSFFYRLAERI